MSPRREVNSLLTLTIRVFEEFLQGIIITVAPEIVRYHNECTKNDLECRLASQNYQFNKENNTNENENGIDEIKDDVCDVDELKFSSDENYETQNEERYVNYRKELTIDYVERLRDYIFSHIPYSLVEDIKNKVK